MEDADNLSRLDLLRNIPATVRFVSAEPLLGPLPKLDLQGIGWVIVGGESGRGETNPEFRPMQAEWVRDIRDQCQAAKIPFFFKQWASHLPGQSGRKLDGREWLEFPTVA